MYQFENNIIYTKNFPLEEIYHGGIGTFCFNFMKNNKNNIAEIDATTGEQETYESLLLKSIRISIILQNKGIEKGDMISIYSKIQLNASVPLLSCFFIGAIPTVLDSELTSLEIINLLKQSNPKLILTSSAMVATIKTILKNGNLNNTLILTFDKEFNSQQENETEFKPIYVKNLQEVALIPFSSGSTGLPKGICLSHYSFLRRNIYNEDYWLKDKKKVMFSYDSFYWGVEILRLMCCIRYGVCRLIDSTPFDAKRTWHLLEKYKVNFAFIIPYCLMEMYNVGKPDNLNISSLTTIMSVGSTLSAKVHSNLQELLPTVDIFLSYGQTEAGLIITFRKLKVHREYNRKNPGSIGLPVDGLGISFKVTDIKTGENLGPNKAGELRIKSDTIMSGYYNLDYFDQFDESGWLKTGDIVQYDEAFCFFFVGRIKDVILYQGFHVPPVFIESELLTHSAVKRAIVIGTPHEMDEEHALGLVVLKDNFKSVTARDIECYVNERLPDRFKLRAGVKIIDESNIIATKKVKRNLLKKLVLSGKL